MGPPKVASRGNLTTVIPLERRSWTEEQMILIHAFVLEFLLGIVPHLYLVGYCMSTLSRPQVVMIGHVILSGVIKDEKEQRSHLE